MKRHLVGTTLVLACSLALAFQGFAQQYGQQGQQRQQQGMTGQQQADQYAQQLSPAENIKGMKIQSLQGEELGSVDQLIVDTREGKLAYVVTASGGMMGMGGEKVIIPWNALRMQPARQGQQQMQQQQQQGRQQRQQQGEQVLVLSVPREQLRQAPQGDLQTVLDRQQGLRIHQFYGVAPYWQEGQQQMMQPRQRMQPGQMMHQQMPMQQMPMQQRPMMQPQQPMGTQQQ